ncbi:MAG: PBP1A family penicillin-binding protein [Aquificae bacterium]|nr:PBP1A family penicillin-binding protein [Aquificota bacterium]
MEREQVKDFILELFKAGILFSIFLALLGILVFLVVNLRNLPDIRQLENWKPSEVTRVYAHDGTLLTEFFIQKRVYITIDKIPEHIKQAFISIEDRTFYKNIGIDPIGIVRATFQNLTSGKIVAGGSTISQQLIKNLFLTPERSFSRKLKEMILAIKLNRLYPKDKILEMYLNYIYLGHGSYGIESASQVYFGKHAWELDLCEAAVLAGLPKAPSRYDPYVNPEGATERRNAVIKAMFEEGYITKQQADECLNKPIQLSEENGKGVYQDYFTEMVRQWAVSRFGWDVIYKGGYEIYTTIDKNMQKNASAILKDRLNQLQRYVGFPEMSEEEINELTQKYQEQKIGKFLRYGRIYIGLIKKIGKQHILIQIKEHQGVATFKGSLKNAEKLLKEYSQIPVYVKYLGGEKFEIIPYIEGAVVTLDSKTGAIRTLIGGYDFHKTQFNRAIQAKRQPGSAFKPIVYTAALLDGYTQVSILKDKPLAFWDEDLNQEWIPTNYYDKYFGDVTLRYALVHSLNAATVYLMSKLGFEKVIPLAKKLGIKSKIPQVYPIALGSVDISPLELAQVYSVYSNSGVKCEPYFVEQVIDPTGELVYKHEQNCTKVLPEDTNAILVDILKGVITEGTGRKAKVLNLPLAGKTGTTDDFTDAWFVGFSPEITTAVWVGYDIKKKIGKHITGAKGALPIWIDYMATYYSDREISDFPLPENVVYVPIDPVTHFVSIDDCQKEDILFIKGTEPELNCKGELAITIPELENQNLLEDEFLLDYETQKPPKKQMEKPTDLQDNNDEEEFMFDLR